MSAGCKEAASIRRGSGSAGKGPACRPAAVCVCGFAELPAQVAGATEAYLACSTHRTLRPATHACHPSLPAQQSVQEAAARALGSLLSGLLSRYPTNQHAPCTDVYTLGGCLSRRGACLCERDSGARELVVAGCVARPAFP